MKVRTLEELEIGFSRIEAAQACRNLMAKYSYYHTASRQYEYIDLWAKRDDCSLQMPWGRYGGFEGVRACYTQDHADRSLLDDPSFKPGHPLYFQLYGGMPMHAMDTECLEVAGDCKTARGCWVSPGHETFIFEGAPSVEWCWGKYAVEFICENGEWKIWKMRLMPLFKCDYYTSWVDTPQPTFIGEDTTIQEGGYGSHSLENIGPAWVYSADAIYPAHEPDPPLPYETYEDIGYTLYKPRVD